VIDLEIPEPYLLNRDIKPSNIIKGEDESVWILDWENAILGDPLYDLALFGARYGHGTLWKRLKEGYGLNSSSPKYALYEIIGLIGIIDFYQKYQINYRGRQNQFRKFVQRFSFK